MQSEEKKKKIEHNSFNTSSGNEEYKITFETNNKNNYLFMQELARLFIDRNYKPNEFERLKINNEYLQKELNQEKEKNKELEEQNKIQQKQLNDAFDRGFIHKDKIRKKIEELEKEKKNYTFAGAFVDGQIGILKRLLEE